MPGNPFPGIGSFLPSFPGLGKWEPFQSRIIIISLLKPPIIINP